MSNDVDDFEDFFAEVNGYSPFPWQRRLCERILHDGRWPALLNLPTGTGKTSAIDIALFCLARRPDIFPRRIVMVADRRVIVDQGAGHAVRVRSAMMTADGTAAAEVAAALRRLFGGKSDASPFAIAVLRGGMPKDESWADRPDRPTVAFSTVDQVGSRLLFRGYGVSRRMAPIHAGLLGNDTLFLLDEVHLSTAFAQTLGALEKRWRPWHRRHSGYVLPDRWAFVRMSATPLESASDSGFELSGEDREHAVLARRLGARKLVRVETVRVGGEAPIRSARFAEACAKEAMARIDEGARTIAVIVNRVESARRVHALLQSADREFDVVLVTGRMRPLDRDDLMGTPSNSRSLISGLRAGRIRSAESRRLILVSTQAIEAGADFDFDAIVTECASLDALRQRFGRVDRFGELGETRSTILARHDQVTEKALDPIYGAALAATWHWLEERAGQQREGTLLDFGIAGFPTLPESDPERRSLFTEAVNAPVLFPAHIDAWAQTNPRPEPDPDIALWLHGPSDSLPDVRIVWRADLKEADLQDADSVRLLPQLTITPPSSLESISIPLPAARSWLARRKVQQIADVVGPSMEKEEDEVADGDDAAARRCLRITHNKTEILMPSEIRPGDTLIVPSSYGGISHGNWDPESVEFVTDLGDWAQLLHRGRPVLRLIPHVVDSLDASGGIATVDSSADEVTRLIARLNEEQEGYDAAEDIEHWFDLVLATTGSKLQTIVSALRKGGYRIAETPSGWFALIGKKRLDVSRLSGSTEDATGEIVTDDDDSSSFTGVALTLGTHLSDVERQVRAFAQNLGLPENVAGDVALAAALHDVGKADPRFQQLLAGGSEVRLALQSEPFAKSAGEMRDVRARELARRRAGYPLGYRHEILSVAMLEGCDEVMASAHDRDLVLHLVGSHHGWGRPFAPAVDPGPSLEVRFELKGTVMVANAGHALARLDSGVGDRFFALVERYGWWGLAWLEAILRLADHVASEEAVSSRRRSRDSSSVIDTDRGWTMKRNDIRGDGLPISGLDGANPLGFLAAVGLLRVLSYRSRLNGSVEPRMRWIDEGYWLPVLYGYSDMGSIVSAVLRDKETWADEPALLLAYDETGEVLLDPRTAGEKATRDLKPAPAVMREFLETIAELAEKSSDSGFSLRRSMDTASSYGTEIVQDNNGSTKPTALHFTAGQQRFLDAIAKLQAGVGEADLHEALVGPWKRQSKLPSMSWDATTARIYALRATDPSGEKRGSTPGADWLAFTGLGLFLSVAEGRQLRTTGVTGRWKDSSFTWALWTVPSSMQVVRSLVATAKLASLSPIQRKARGIGPVFRSAITRSEQGGYGGFSPARII